MTVSSDSDQYNKDAYASAYAAEKFAEDTVLQRPEQYFLDQLKEQLPSMAMLDIGVGTGRTTPFFAQYVRKYVGIDYSASMIEVCCELFPATPHMRFAVCDATDMCEFEDQSFDFILFSYNGIDVLSHEKRLKVFEEVRRVGKTNGIFVFSSHNLLCIRKMFTIQLNRKVKRLWESVRRCILTRMANESYRDLRSRPYALIKEPTHFLKLQHYYITPLYQIEQLHTAGFTDVHVVGLEGAELSGEKLSSTTDSWLYYICTINK